MMMMFTVVSWSKLIFTCVCLQTLKNIIWSPRRILYLVLAGLLLSLIYFLSNLGSARNVRQTYSTENKNKEFLKVVQEAKRIRDDSLQKPYTTTTLLPTVVIHDVP